MLRRLRRAGKHQRDDESDTKRDGAIRSDPIQSVNVKLSNQSNLGIWQRNYLLDLNTPCSAKLPKQYVHQGYATFVG